MKSIIHAIFKIKTLILKLFLKKRLILKLATSTPPTHYKLAEDYTVSNFNNKSDITPNLEQSIIKNLGLRYIKEVNDNFNRGADLWVLFNHENFAGYLWTIQKSNLKTWYIDLKKEDVVLFSINISPSHRGKQLAPRLINHVIYNHLMNNNCFYLDTMQWNKRAIKSFVKAGFKIIS